MNIGIFGGTFDPPHLGHLIAAQDACAALRLDRLVFVPAAQPPHKPRSAVSPADIRAEMLRAAVAGDARFEVSRVELDRAGPSYTVDTIGALARLNPQAMLYLLIGVDQVRDFGSWKHPEQIARSVEVVMLARSGVERADGASFVSRTVPVTRVDISSTMIRSRVAAGEPIRYLVPDAVGQIIEREGLYR